MAFTVDIIDKNVTGKLRHHIASITADAVSGNIDSGLAYIVSYTMAPQSMATAAIVMKKNIGSGATARNGILNVNGAVNGDVFQIHFFGR